MYYGGLDLLSLVHHPHFERRRNPRLVRVKGRDCATLPLDDVTSVAVVTFHKGPSALNGQLFVGKATLELRLDTLGAETLQEDPQCLCLFVGKTKVWHQLLNPFGRVYPGVLQLPEGVILPGLLDLDRLADEQLQQSLVAEVTEIRRNLLCRLKSFDVVAAKATPLAEDRK